MYQLEIKLKQHTPLIHFQHDQDGATLRASEVKPKLDKFILTQLGGAGGYEAGKDIAKKNGWLVGRGDHPALDYQMRINVPSVENREIGKKQRIPMFFGNMNDNSKGISYCKDAIDMTFLSKQEEILDEINNNKTKFFLLNNFGSRQTKGYGSFYPLLNENDSLDPIIKQYGSFYFYYSTKDRLPISSSKDFGFLFQQIDFFYKTLRSGINQNGSYFKSMMYHYAKYNEKYWEKRAIRTNFELFSNSKFNQNNDLSGDDLKQRRNLDWGEKGDYKTDNEKGCNALDKEVKLYRDMLGLSISQEWVSYGAIINKKMIKKEKEGVDIERFKSPILFKPIFDPAKQKYIIFIFPNPICDGFFNQEFEININYKEGESDKGRNTTPLALTTPAVFDVADYLFYVFKGEGRKIVEEQINNMPDTIRRWNKQLNREEEKRNNIKDSLKRIYRIK